MNEKLLQYIEWAKSTKEDNDNLLEVNWLETTDGYVINRGDTILVDGLEEQQAYNLLDQLQAACDE